MAYEPVFGQMPLASPFELGHGASSLAAASAPPMFGAVASPAPVQHFAPAKPPSFLQRALARLFPVPEAMGGLLSNEDLHSARRQGLLALGASMLSREGGTNGFAPTALQALGHGIAAGQQATQGASQYALQAQEAAQQLALQQQQKEAALRIQAQFPMGQAGQSVESTLDNARQAAGAYMQAGMMDKAKDVAASVKDLTPPNEAAAHALISVDGGDRMILADPKTGKPIYTYPKGLPPQTSEQVQQHAQQLYQREQGIAGDYQQQTKTFATVAQQIGVFNESVAGARRGDAAAQMQMVYSYMHILDPNSSVREGEYANASNAAGVPEVVRNMWNKLQKGAFLPPDAVNRFAAQVNKDAAMWHRRLQPYITHFSRRAKDNGVDPKHVVQDYFDDGGAASTSSAAPSGRAAVPAAQSDTAWKQFDY